MIIEQFKFKKFVKDNWHILILALLPLVQFIIASNIDFEFFWGFNNFHISNFINIWAGKDLGIIPGYYAPFYLFLNVLSKLFSHKIGVILLWWGIYVLGAIGVGLSFRKILSLLAVKSNQLIELIVGFFYIFFVPSQFLPVMPFSFNLVYALFPLLVYILLSFIDNECNNIFYYSVIFALFLFLFLGIQVIFYIYIAFGLLFMLILGFLYKKISLKKLCIFILSSFLIFLLLGFPYIYTAIVLPQTTQGPLVNEMLSLENPTFTQSNSYLVETYKIMGMTSYYYYYNGAYSIPSATTYYLNPYYTFLAYYGVIVLALMFLLLSKSRYKKISLLLMTLFLISIFLMSGVHAPPLFNTIYKYLSGNFIFFNALRNSYKIYFLVLFIFTISLGLLLKHLLDKQRHKLLIVVVFCLPLLILARPLYTPDFYNSSNIHVPIEVLNSINYITTNMSDTRILLVPITPFPIFNFSTRGFNVYETATNFNVLANTNSAGSASKLLRPINQAILDNNVTSFCNSMDIIATDYVLWSGYIDTQQYQIKSPQQWLPFFEKNFERIYNTDNIKIYKVCDNKNS